MALLGRGQPFRAKVSRPVKGANTVTATATTVTFGTVTVAATSVRTTFATASAVTAGTVTANATSVRTTFATAAAVTAGKVTIVVTDVRTVIGISAVSLGSLNVVGTGASAHVATGMGAGGSRWPLWSPYIPATTPKPKARIPAPEIGPRTVMGIARVRIRRVTVAALGTRTVLGRADTRSDSLALEGSGLRFDIPWQWLSQEAAVEMTGARLVTGTGAVRIGDLPLRAVGRRTTSAAAEIRARDVSVTSTGKTTDSIAERNRRAVLILTARDPALAARAYRKAS